MTMIGGLVSLLGLRGKRKSASKIAAAVFDALETRTLLAATLSPEGVLLVTGTEAADAIVVRVNAAGTDVQVQGAGSGIALFRLTAVQSVRVQAGGGDDSLTLDAAAGLLGHAGAPLPIQYDGGAGADTLVLSGAPAGVSVTETITPGPGAGAGKVSSQGGQVTQSVEFSGIESLLDTSAAASLTINLGDGGNLVEVSGGAAVNGAATGTIKAFDVTLCDVPAPVTAPLTASVAATSSAVMAGGEGEATVAPPATPADGPGKHGRGKAKGHLKQKHKKPKK
jgi:hypothetical protein